MASSIPARPAASCASTGASAAQLPGAQTIWGYSLALLLFTLATKTVLVARSAFAEPGLWQGPWSLPALYGEDVLLVTLFAILQTGLAFLAPERRAGKFVDRFAATIYASAALFLACNVPLTLVLGSPLTFSLLHAGGTALSDSILRYVSPLNLSVAGGLLATAGILPHLARRLLARLNETRALAVAVVLSSVLLAGPAAVSRVDTRGLQRNAIITFVASYLRRAQAQLAPAVDLPACTPFAPTTSTPAPIDRATSAAVFRPGRARSIVWVILESTGARFLSPYGGARETTPHLAALADQSLIAQHAYAAYPESIKGLYSVLCSRTPPPETEAAQYLAGRLPCAPVATALAQAGYRTGLFHAGHFAYLGMDAVVGGRGFATLSDAATIPSRFKSSFGIDETATVDALLGWVDEDTAPPQRPFFAVYMPIAGHHPYHAPGQASRPFPERSARDEHRNDLHVVDEAVGRLRAGLTARGLDDQIVYVVVGDHGEAFEEHHGNIGHALHLYEENVRVPFFIALPGRLAAPTVWNAPVSLLDLGPTTLAIAGLRPAAAAEGIALLQIPATRVLRFSTEQAQRQVGLIDGQRKLILDRETGRTRLYDLDTDPDEQTDHALRPTIEESRFMAHHQSCLSHAGS